MKRLFLLCIFAFTSLTASANQIGMFFRDTSSADPSLPNLAPKNDAYFSVSGNNHGTANSYVDLTYDFVHPLKFVEFGFTLSGAGQTPISGTATASYSDEINIFVNDNAIHYFVVYVEDGDLKKVNLRTFAEPFNNINPDPSDDFLNIVSIRAIPGDAASVPEPGTATLFGIALAGMLGIARFKRRL